MDLELLYEGNRLEAGINTFTSKQTNDIVEGGTASTGEYVNLGQARFHGGEMEAKYFLSKNLLLLGSGSYQSNKDGSGDTNITPVANLAGKGGISYQAANGISASLFDVHQGPLSGNAQAANPHPRAYDLLNTDLRYDLCRPLRCRTNSIALTVQGNDLLNRAVWLPDWKDVPGDSIFFIRGRTVMAGMRVSF